MQVGEEKGEAPIRTVGMEADRAIGHEPLALGSAYSLAQVGLA